MLIPILMSDALNAFEARMKRRTDHPAFSKFGKVTVTRSDVKKWSDDWSLDEVTEAEKKNDGRNATWFGGAGDKTR